jgi:hypothetical protein
MGTMFGAGFLAVRFDLHIQMHLNLT